ADLRGADLRGAYLSDADLRDADLSDAYLSDAKIPKVEGLAQAVLDAADRGELRMADWHATCGTVHCKAGWATFLAGDPGKALELEIGSSAAGALIWWASEGVVPNFYADDAAAHDWLRRHVEAKAEASSAGAGS
ncbi:MAG: pentapeptide repeat-containing protein, partial [Acidobacteriota bacterium]